eukprot:gnl/TRDRNA2_/TRDRNA2_193740_c0_seq1.p1 gnl/TRDRNA2_/TRDRNA2_193740_c0~~gnl/TRDRNA2_/TRDRNA2_193740_c0_seq1.p1  ORF type:complete len:203 (+),score=33.69 gnl/TRDRNA2_/TRDRNA2_193740_c0_seq1:81-689(+)
MEAFRCLLTLLAALVGALGATHEVDCSTTAGNFSITLDDKLSPKGVERFLELVHAKFFDSQILYRVIPGFLVQFGVAADPQVQKVWQGKKFQDEPKMTKFKHGTVSFAGNGKDSRSCHIFIAFQPNGLSLGNAPHETPIGEVTVGLGVLDKIQQNFRDSKYGDLTKLQGQLVQRGNAAADSYPKLDRIGQCRLHVEARTQDL